MRKGVNDPPRLNSRAFTLVELLVVVGVILVLAAVSMPSLFHAVTKARLEKDAQNMKNVYGGFRLYAMDNNGEICPGFDPAATNGAYPMYVKYIANYLYANPAAVLATSQSVFQSPAHTFVSYGGSFRMNAYVDQISANYPRTHFNQFQNQNLWLFLFESGTPTTAGAGHGADPSLVMLRYDGKSPFLFLDGHVENRSAIDPVQKGFWEGKPSPATTN